MPVRFSRLNGLERLKAGHLGSRWQPVATSQLRITRNPVGSAPADFTKLGFYRNAWGSTKTMKNLEINCFIDRVQHRRSLIAVIILLTFVTFGFTPWICTEGSCSASRRVPFQLTGFSWQHPAAFPRPLLTFGHRWNSWSNLCTPKSEIVLIVSSCRDRRLQRFRQLYFSWAWRTKLWT